MILDKEGQETQENLTMVKLVEEMLDSHKETIKIIERQNKEIIEMANEACLSIDANEDKIIAHNRFMYILSMGGVVIVACVAILSLAICYNRQWATYWNAPMDSAISITNESVSRSKQ